MKKATLHLQIVFELWCRWWESNPHGCYPQVFETCASAYSATSTYILQKLGVLQLC